VCYGPVPKILGWDGSTELFSSVDFFTSDVDVVLWWLGGSIILKVSTVMCLCFLGLVLKNWTLNLGV
jgi:hypothetical protein